MIWWLSNAGRALTEIAAIEELQQSVSWLRDVTHRLDQSGLVYDFEIVDGDNAWRLSMKYPPFFPSIPPQVFNAENQLISGHQYGAAGELCLEFRPDNWDQSITGAMMIESAYRLLSGESEDSPTEGVASAHSLIEGQRLRGSRWRFLARSDVVAVLQDRLQPREAIPFEASEHFQDALGLVHITAIGGPGERLWAMKAPVAGTKYSGIAIRLPSGLSIPDSYDKTFLDILLLNADVPAPRPGGMGVYLFVGDEGVSLAMLMNDKEGNERLFVYRTVVLADESHRLPEENLTLATKRVGLVGCGSLGSKMAAMLIRSGCRNLTLVDADLLMPGNLVRNELDWRGVGAHKVEALKARLLEIAPDAEIATRVVYLGGQESAGWTGSSLEALASCDLIVDVTADPTVFGLTAAAARHGDKPMVWAEVFAGGIGGLVARARPKKEPPPDVARQRILAWCDEHGQPWEQVSTPIDYGVARDQQAPLIADDADVSAIAAHAARLAIDSLKPDSQFPNPAYVIGLSKGWIFTQPFEVHPISYSSEEAWGKIDAGDNIEDLKKLGAILFPDEGDDDASFAAQ
jgi:hypothetical protein